MVAVRAPERRVYCLRRLLSVGEPQPFFVHGRAVRAVEVRRAARVDVEAAAAATPNAFFDSLNGGVVVYSRNRWQRSTRPAGVVDTARARGVLKDSAHGRGGRDEESPSTHVIVRGPASSFTVYPAFARCVRPLPP